MSEPLENLYFNWLCAKVIHLENSTPSLSYWNLFRQLHGTEYVWLISGDDNRAEDGVELRDEFLMEARLEGDDSWRHSPCSVLEMFVAFSRRCRDAIGETSQFWFWRILENLGLREANDASHMTSDEIADILNTFLWRNYDEYGFGGMFPMTNPPKDQREVEVWYQFCEYLVDQDWPL